MPRSNGKPLLVGVTGGIASGKTLVCRTFERSGIPVLYADDIAKTISTSRRGVRREIAQLLGEEAYQKDGSLNRAYIARKIFSQKRLQQRMNAIVHPRVRRELRAMVRRLAATGHRLVVIEAALIFESGMNAMLDYVIVVDAPREVRIRRALGRGGISRTEVLRRMRAQWSTRTKRTLADVVIDNSGSRRELQQAVRLLVALFKRMSTS